MKGGRTLIQYEKLHHVSLPVRHIERSVKFYEEVLFLEPLERPPFDFEGAWFRAGNDQIHLIVFDETVMIREKREICSREAHFALRVKSYEETLQWLKSHNVDVLEKPNSKSGFSQLFCTDPDGHIIELHVVRENERQSGG